MSKRDNRSLLHSVEELLDAIQEHYSVAGNRAVADQLEHALNRTARALDILAGQEYRRNRS